MKKAIIAFAMIFSLVSITGCTSTKVNGSLSKQAEIEKINASEYIDLNIPDNLMDTINKTTEDLQATDEETLAAINETYLSDKMEPEQLTDKTIEEGDVVNLTYVCYKNGMFMADYSKTGTPIDVTITTEEQEEHPAELLAFLIGKKSSGEYEYASTIGDEEKGETVFDVTYTITVNYAEGEDIYPDAEEYFNNNAYLQSDYKTYNTFFSSMRVKKTAQKKEQAFYDILNEIANNSTFTKDHSLLTRGQYKSLYYNHEAMAASYGLSWDTYLLTIGFDNEKDFEKELMEDAEALVKEKIVYFAILQEKELSLDIIDYNNEVKTMSINWGFDSVNECLNIYGSDILRFECIRKAHQDIILAYGIKGYAEEYVQKLQSSEDATSTNIDADIIDTEESEDSATTPATDSLIAEKGGDKK